MQAFKNSISFELLFIIFASLFISGCGGGGADTTPPSTTPVVSLSSLNFNTIETNLKISETVQITVTGSYSDGSTKDLTTSVTWESSNTEIASISNAGELLGISVGTTTISATLGSIKTSLEITVSPASLQSVAVSFSSSQIPVGLTATYTAEGVYSDGSIKDLTSLVTWSVSNSAVIDVSNTGLITALSAGSSTVTAIYDGQSFVGNLVVIELIDLSISPTTVNLPIQSSIQLSVTGRYADNSSESLDHLVTWGSSNTDIASITNTGEVLGISAGSTSVSATFGSINTSLVVTVSPASLQSLIVNSPTTQIPIGLTSTNTAKGIYSDGTEKDLSNQVLWTVSDPSIASIDSETGLLTALKTGTLSINASKGGLTSSLEVSVSPATLTGIAITPTEISLAKGSQTSVNVTANFSDNTKVDVSDQVTWANENEQVVSIENNPLTIVSLKEGTTTLTASLNEQQAELLINVTNAELVSLDVYPVNNSIPIGHSQQFYAHGTFSDGEVQDLTSEVTWLSSNENHVVVSNAKSLAGLAESIALGNATLTAVSGQIQQDTTLTVTNAHLSHIEIVPTTLALPKESNVKIKALGHFSDGFSIDLTTKVIWSTSNASALDVLSAKQGLLQSSGPGSALLSATLDGVVGLANISVTDSTLQSIAISAPQTKLPKGMNQRLIATGTYSDMSTRDISHQVTWQSDDVHIASVSNSSEFGLLQAVNPGQVTITASLGSVSSEFTINVTDAELTKIEISTAKSKINVQTILFSTAVASFSDSSNMDVSSQVNWSSSDINIASIANIKPYNGKITGLSSGSVDLSASLMGINSGAVPVEVLLDPNLPKAINLSVKPNLIINNNNDAAEVELVIIPSLESGVIADGTPVTLTINEGNTSRDVTLATTNGAVNYSLESEYDGFITLSAAYGDYSVNSGIISTDTFKDAILVTGGTKNFIYENNALKAGSTFYILLRNLTNRKFVINQINIGYLDPNNNNSFVNFPDSPETREKLISDGNLSAGEFAGIGYQLDNDIDASVYVISYQLFDGKSNTFFRIEGAFNFAN